MKSYRDSLPAWMRFPAYVWVLALGFPAIVLTSQLRVMSKAPLGLVGMLPSHDYASYSAVANGYRLRGAFLAYPWPYVLNEQSYHSVMWELCLGWLRTAFGSFDVAWFLFTVFFGVLAMLLLYRLVFALELPPRWRCLLFLVCSVGAGFGWEFAGLSWAIDTAARSVSGDNVVAPLLVSHIPLLAGKEVVRTNAFSLEQYWLMFDHPQSWWNMSVFRMYHNAADLLNHSLLYGTILVLLRGRFLAAGVLVPITFWAHPAAGVSLAWAVGIYALLELCWGERRRDAFVLGFATAVVGAIGAGYYLWLESFSAGMRATAAVDAMFNSMTPYGSAATFGPPLALVAAGLWVAGPKALVATPALRLVTGWALAEALLLWCLPFISELPQPLHFARGFMYPGLAILGVLLLNHGGAKLPRVPSGVSRIVLCLGLLALFGDNFLFHRKYLSQEGGFVLTRAQVEVIDLLKDQEPSEVILTVPEKTPESLTMGIVIYTHHRCVPGYFEGIYGHTFNKSRLAHFAQTPTPDLPRELGATLLVIPTDVWERAGRPLAAGATRHYVLVRTADYGG